MKVTVAGGQKTVIPVIFIFRGSIVTSERNNTGVIACNPEGELMTVLYLLSIN